MSVDAIAPDGTRSFAQVAIIPTEIDLLLDSDSYVPPFYRGRALASPGTRVRLEAIPHFVRPGGSEIPASDLTYTWRRNDETIAGVSGPGKSSATIASPVLFGTDIISVEAVSADGALSGSASMRIPSTETVLALYEDHPLYGILYNRALGSQTLIPDSEMTFAAVPYFAQARSADDPTLEYTWRVNDSSVKADAARPSELTINAQNSNGLALVALELASATNVFLRASREWGITLSAQSGFTDQFRASGQ